MEAKQRVVSHESLSYGYRICRPDFVETQIEVDQRLILFDGITKVLSDSARLPMPLAEPIPAKVHYFELRILPQNLSDAGRTRTRDFVPAKV